MSGRLNFSFNKCPQRAPRHKASQGYEQNKSISQARRKTIGWCSRAPFLEVQEVAAFGVEACVWAITPFLKFYSTFCSTLWKPQICLTSTLAAGPRRWFPTPPFSSPVVNNKFSFSTSLYFCLCSLLFFFILSSLSLPSPHRWSPMVSGK